MKNWKTTLGGILSATGLTLTASGSSTLHTVGIIMAAAGALLTGLGAKDHNTKD